MYNIRKYSIFFIVLVLLQVFLFDNLNLSVYIHPLVYVAVLVLLPMQTRPISTLGLGLLLGLCVDFLSGNAGLHTIASLSTAFFRPYILTLIVGREDMKEGGMPMPEKLGMGKFVKYLTAVVLAHCAVFFFFESPSSQYFYLTLIRIVLSGAVSMFLITLSYLAFKRY